MKKTTKQQIERVLALADTTLEELAVATHQEGFTSVMVHLDGDGFIDKAELVYELNYKINAPVGWRTIYECGTGTRKCTETYCSTEDVAEGIAKNLRTLTNQNKQ